jgi:hypothetical protein
VASAQDLAVWLDTGALALSDAAATCGTLAQALAGAQADVAELRDRSTVLRLDVAAARERSHQLALAMSTGCGTSVLPGASLVCDDPALRAQRDHLEADVGDLRARSRGVALGGTEAAETAARAGAAAAASFQRIAGSTFRARADRAAQAARDQRLHDTWAANSTWPSQVRGFGSALVDDVVAPFRHLGPMPTIVDPGRLLDQLTSTWDQVTHPADTATRAFDVPDLQDHAYGHWAGTFIPGALASVLTDGAALDEAALDKAALDETALDETAETAAAATDPTVGVAAAADVAAAEAEAEAVAAALKEAEAALAAQPVYSWGGLAAHEDPTGKLGHTIAKHVERTDEFLAKRLVTETRLQAASTFDDLATADRLVDEALTGGGAHIAQWLAGTKKSFAVHLASASAVGRVLLRGAAVTVDAHRIKVVLLRDTSRPTGFRILTVKICP